ncbi:MAG: phage terminase large subunit [Alphaproteobacteria bacterium]|nr:phage terminase large subunit [Alphaproteobacteria bacterium]
MTCAAEPRSAPGFVAFVDEWNGQQGLVTPPIHRRMAEWLAGHAECGSTRLVLLAFRSSGKSTLVGLFCAWLLARTPDLRVLVLAAEEGLAKKMVRNVKRIVERHPATAGLKPARAQIWASDQFVVERQAELRDPSMLARGLAGNITGSRADVVICDDVEVPNTSDTPGKRADLRERLAEIDYVLVPGGLQLYIGTPHTYYSIYADAARPEAGETVPFLAGFERLTIPVRDTEGTFAWPERFGAARVAEVLERTGPQKFRAQMLLQPTADGACRLDPDRLVPYDEPIDFSEANGRPVLRIAGRQMISASCWWDPSYGTTKGDRSVVAIVFTDELNHAWLHEVAYLAAARRDGEDEAQGFCRQVAAFAIRNRAPSVAIETNGLGAFLPGLLRRELSRSGAGCAVTGVHSSIPKTRRILDAFDARLAAGMLHAHRDVLKTPFPAEMREWRAEATAGRDDGLDAVAGCLLAEPVRFAAPPRPERSDWRPGAGGHRAHTDFRI